MAHYLVELYTPKPAWLALDGPARAAFFDRIGAGMGALSDLGIEPVTLSEAAPDTLGGTGHRFLAVWRCPDPAAAQALVAGIAATGWHDYFDTVNAIGAEDGLEAHLGALAAL